MKRKIEISNSKTAILVTNMRDDVYKDKQNITLSYLQKQTNNVLTNFISRIKHYKRLTRNKVQFKL